MDHMSIQNGNPTPGSSKRDDEEMFLALQGSNAV